MAQQGEVEVEKSGTTYHYKLKVDEVTTLQMSARLSEEGTTIVSFALDGTVPRNHERLARCLKALGTEQAPELPAPVARRTQRVVLQDLQGLITELEQLRAKEEQRRKELGRTLREMLGVEDE